MVMVMVMVMIMVIVNKKTLFEKNQCKKAKVFLRELLKVGGTEGAPLLCGGLPPLTCDAGCTPPLKCTVVSRGALSPTLRGRVDCVEWEVGGLAGVGGGGGELRGGGGGWGGNS